MFTHAELVKNWKTLAASASPGVDLIEYDQFAFHDPRNEFHIDVYSSPRDMYASALHFWVSALAPETKFLAVHGYFTNGSVEDLACDAYESTVRFLASHLREPLPEDILFRGNLVEAAKIWLLIGDDAVIATFEDRYVALRFYSTA